MSKEVTAMDDRAGHRAQLGDPTGRFEHVEPCDAPAGRQLTLMFGRVVVLPDGEEIVEELEHVRRNVFAARTHVELVPVVVDLTPQQARWIGTRPPVNPTCPGCVLFGCCAAHDMGAA